jgi:hypothetical protein
VPAFQDRCLQPLGHPSSLIPWHDLIRPARKWYRVGTESECQTKADIKDVRRMFLLSWQKVSVDVECYGGVRVAGAF